MSIIDLRSDTVTKPTVKMREVMAVAKVGDDVYGEDPTMNKLEVRAAELLGKEAALFIPSGTMGNQLAIMTHTTPGNEILLGAYSHIFYYEVGALAKLSGVQARTLDDKQGIFNPEELKGAIRGEDIHYPETALVCLENTHNKAGGIAVSKERIDQICKVAAAYNLPVHLDGARLFNAVVALEIDAKDLVQNVDSVMFCLSKGLAAPVGSILAGNKEFIERARKNRKMLGGGMRQAGILAAAGLVALEEMIDRLEDDHKLAVKLGEEIKKLNLDYLKLKAVNTNFVILEVNEDLIDSKELIDNLDQKGVKLGELKPGLLRLVIHHNISEEDVAQVIEVLEKI